ncbi:MULTISPECIES: VOC family protein [unclassified Salinibacterium]|uniref:VOC family protein n=1 Tax=Salinibacterium sp. GXW1014 TaxID=3377838 RepID=UPI001A063B31|nr:VOC family protein [Salinibacterium sp.]MBF0672956.1 VOC family protein [Salinibacterium sp.]
MLTIGSVVLGVRDIPTAVEFWCTALDYQTREQPEVDWATLIPRNGVGVPISLMQVTSDARTHRRHHLDLYAADQQAEVARLLALGAHEVHDWEYEDDADYVVLEDPDGNRFCVVDKG